MSEFHLSLPPTRLLISICFVLSLATCGAAGEETRSGANRKALCPTTEEVLAASAKIDRSGAFKDTVNYDLNEKVLGLAQCYSRMGEVFAAEVVTRVLLRYAEVIRDWPLIGRDGKAQEVVDFARWDLGGLWGGEWVYLDLRKSANLARAFELVAKSTAVDDIGRQLGVDARTVIREKLLRYLADFNLRFGRGVRLGTATQEAMFTFTNMDYARLKALVVFGRVVDPAYIHIAVRFLRLFPTVGFFRDGFWHEGTISYHRQIVRGLVSLVKDLKGYTDPPGYEHSGYTTLFGNNYLGVPGRFDNLKPLGGAAQDFARLEIAERPLTLPDGRMVAKNDTHHTAKGNPLNAPSRSTCLFALRHCVLVLKQGKAKTLLHLAYGGTEGHEHYDALHVDFWASGLMLGDGSYKLFSPWEWNASTAAHNTVVVNRVNQDSRFQDREPLTIYDRIDGVGHHLFQGYGQGDSANWGNLLAADLSGGAVQYVAADATRAYDSKIPIQKYQRTLILVRGERGSSYVVDVFNVEGGTKHEWMLHGDLASDAALQTTLDEKPSKGELSPYLKIERSAKANGHWSSDLVYPDGRRLRTYHLGAVESDVAIARAPAQVRNGTANYLSVGKPGPQNLFVAVHVPARNESPVKTVTFLPSKQKPDGCVHVKIEFASGRSDEVAILSRQGGDLSGECTTDESRITHVATAPDGRCLWRYQGDVATPTSSWNKGAIEVLRQQAGGKRNGFRIASWPAPDDSLAPALLHVNLPNGNVESYVIRNVERFADQSVFVEVEGEPGLRIATKPGLALGTPVTHVKQLYYPSRGFIGPVTYRTTTNAMQRCDEN